MSLFDAFRYDGKRVLVVGGATGMGAAAAELALDAGADVVVMDLAPVTLAGVTAMELNLGERASVEAAVDACGGQFDAVFSCAGVAEGFPGIERINFVGHRHLLERLLAKDMIPRGGAICFISSTAGMGWEANFAELTEVLDIDDYDTATTWMLDHDKANYVGTKQAICSYVARRSFSLIAQGVRINAICPGPTDTPLAQANDWLSNGADFREATGTDASSPMEQAYPMVFLCSDAASAITGITLVSDKGWSSSGLTDAYPPAAIMNKFMFGRISLEELMASFAPPEGGA